MNMLSRDHERLERTVVREGRAAKRRVAQAMPKRVAGRKVAWKYLVIIIMCSAAGVSFSQLFIWFNAGPDLGSDWISSLIWTVVVWVPIWLYTLSFFVLTPAERAAAYREAAACTPYEEDENDAHIWDTMGNCTLNGISWMDDD